MSAVNVSNAVTALRQGGVIAYPTEAVFGLGCDARCEAALEKVIALKGRDSGKGMIVIAADYQQLTTYLANPGETLRKKILGTIDTPTTWVVDAADELSPLLTGGRDTIAVRITQHPVAAALCREFGGAITSTSANISGREPARNARDVRAQFPAGVAHIIDAATGTLAQPTRIVDARTDEILR